MKLNYKRTFFIGLAFLSICAFWQLYDTIIPLILQNTFHMGETLTGVIMALDNVLALFMLPIFGALSDRIDTPLGKRTPFILTGTCLAVIFLLMIPVANQGKNFTLFFICLAFVLISMGLYRSPAVALMPDLTPKSLRSKANAIINLMGAMGGIYALVMIKNLIQKEDTPNYLPVFLSVALIMILAVIILLFTVNEKKLSKEMKAIDFDECEPENVIDTEDHNIVDSKREEKQTVTNDREVKKSLFFILASVFLWFTAYNAISTAFSRYAKVVFGLRGGSFADCLMVGTIVAIISYIPIGIISSYLGRKKVIIMGIILMTISYGSGILLTSYSWFLNVLFAITGIGWAAISVNSYPMVVEMSKGSDIGKYTGLYYTFSMLAQTLTPILSGMLLEKVSYRTLFPYAMIFSILSLCTMLCVHHGDSKPTRRREILENFDVDD